MAKRRDAPRVTDQHRRRQERLRQLVKREKTQKAFADKHDLNSKHLSQMLRPPGSKNWRGIGNEIVEQLESDTKLRLGKGWFDAQEVSELLSAGLAESRPKNNVKALRIALQSLFSVLQAKERSLAAAVAEDIVATAGTSFVAQGFLGILVAQLLGVPEMSEDELRELLQSPASPTSKRGVSVAK